MIESMDESVGHIVETLERLKLSDNTLVFFTSDNGGLSAPEWKKVPVTCNAPLREGKGHFYEGGIRVPLIVAGPGVRSGRVEATPMQSIDFLPTILDFAGAQPQLGVDGVSIAGLLRNGTPPAERDLYWHYPHYGNQIGRPSSAIRRGTWKLIEFHEDRHAELYDLSEDMGEQKDLAAVFPARVRELQDRLHAWQKQVHAQFPVPNPNYDPKREEESYWWISGGASGKVGANPVGIDFHQPESSTNNLDRHAPSTNFAGAFSIICRSCLQIAASPNEPVEDLLIFHTSGLAFHRSAGWSALAVRAALPCRQPFAH